MLPTSLSWHGFDLALEFPPYGAVMVCNTEGWLPFSANKREIVSVGLFFCHVTVYARCSQSAKGMFLAAERSYPHCIVHLMKTSACYVVRVTIFSAPEHSAAVVFPENNTAFVVCPRGGAGSPCMSISFDG